MCELNWRDDREEDRLRKANIAHSTLMLVSKTDQPYAEPVVESRSGCGQVKTIEESTIYDLAEKYVIPISFVLKPSAYLDQDPETRLIPIVNSNK
ncbi:hypothetical protein T265_02777 [Opisthorchis viverrini]|uniref:Uncharacterized protein n=1 Tax=Opisthorchis viverrini TaxID=6198 RepID=A0A074ZUN4_OPIVI|nr:hypothetical protein T265_02777 [Opisthorchis viverrini]KER30841.1 hypothetical protein T265_02777 [Opisthorchis viverrini]